MHPQRADDPPAPPRRTHPSSITAMLPLVLVSLAASRVHAREPVAVIDRFRDSARQDMIPVSGWQLRPHLDIRLGHTDNVGWQSTDTTSSAETGLRGSIEAIRETGTATLELRGSHATTLYARGPIRSAHVTNLAMAGTLRASGQLQLRASLGYDIVNAPTAGNGIEIDGVYVNYGSAPAQRSLPIAAGLRFDAGRYRLDLNAESTHKAWDDQVTVTGLPVSQDFRSGWESQLRARATLSLHQALEFFVEGMVGNQRFVNDTADTDSLSLVIGSTFEPHPLVRAELQAGLGQQEYRIADSTTGFVFAGELTWYLSPLVTVMLDGERTFRGSVTTSAGGAFQTQPATTDRIALSADWEPLRQMLVSLGSSWTTDETDSGDRKDTVLTIGLEARYMLTRTLHAFLEIGHETGRSTVIGDVDRNRISLGVTSPY